MEQPLVSILIPVYNASSYIKETIDCIKNQSLRDWEVVMIDDGSKDNSADVISQETANDHRFRLICTENRGVACARNRLIDEAKGRYILFSDADDILHPRAVEVLVNAMQSGNNPDMVFFHYECFSSLRKPNFTNEIKNPELIEDTDLFEFGVDRGLSTSVYTKIFDSQKFWWRRVRFTPGMTFGEDMFYSWKACIASSKALLIDSALYFYRQYPGQAISRYHPNLYDNYRKSFDELEVWTREQGLWNEGLKKSFVRHFGLRIPAIMRMIIRSPFSIKKKIQETKRLQNDERVREFLNSPQNTTGFNNQSAWVWYRKAFTQEMEFRIKASIRRIANIIKK